MADVAKSVLVAYTPEQMFSLVDAVERYPEFLPWCGGASVARRDEASMLATISINYRGIRQSFTTETQRQPGRSIHISLVHGPFKTLNGTWGFVPLAQAGCKVDFHLHYEFSSRLLERAVGPVFHYIADSMVDAFVKRARFIYGNR
ncbi:MAG: ubiquinone-binding protein [Betaproteobacteria bacterium RIFCSPLOWO2_02_64_14]|nr:MAG: ubiquinone-binding protein [Betaproteobacteria bacterium RIFCSPLOWO2_02_64_14]